MLSAELCRKLAELLNKFAEVETIIEENRQILCSCAEFDPIFLFDKLDRLSVGGISAFDFSEFLSEKGVHCSLYYLEILVHQYDSNDDLRLSMSDLFQLILPSGNPLLRQRVEGNNQAGIAYEEERLIAKHIDLEGRFQGELEILKRGVVRNNEFSGVAAFKMIDQEGFGVINSEQVRYFMNKHGFAVTDRELDGIIRRIDTD